MSQTFTFGRVSGAAPSLVGGTGTTAKIFPSLLGPGFNNGGSSTVVQTPAAGTLPCLLTVPGASIYEQTQLDVVASGYVTVAGVSPTVTFVLQNGTSLTAASNTTISTATAMSVTTSASYPYAFKATLQGDSKSGVVQVVSAAFVLNGTAGSLTNTSLTGISFTGSNPALNLCFGITFGVTSASNVASLGQYSVGA